VLIAGARAKGEAWVSRDCGYLVKYASVITGDPDFFGEGVTGPITETFAVSDIGQPVAVQTPTDCPAGLIDAPSCWTQRRSTPARASSRSPPSARWETSSRSTRPAATLRLATAERANARRLRSTSVSHRDCPRPDHERRDIERRDASARQPIVGQIRTVDGDEANAGPTGSSAGEQCLAGSGRADKEHARRRRPHGTTLSSTAVHLSTDNPMSEP
jgi:hypothetical protein